MAALVAQPYLVRVETNGRLHVRYRLFDQVISRSGLAVATGDALRSVDDGRCGIDENWVEADWDRLESADPGALCQFCFPG